MALYWVWALTNQCSDQLHSRVRFLGEEPLCHDMAHCVLYRELLFLCLIHISNYQLGPRWNTHFSSGS